MPAVTDLGLRLSYSDDLPDDPGPHDRSRPFLLNALFALLGLLLVLALCWSRKPTPSPPIYPPSAYPQRSWFSDKLSEIGPMFAQDSSTAPTPTEDDPSSGRTMDEEDKPEIMRQKPSPAPDQRRLRIDTGQRPWAVKSRPPPPPPLTPPTLTNSAFALGHGSSSVPRTRVELDSSFFQHPNPDYSSASSDSTSTALEPKGMSPAGPLRRPYSTMTPLSPPQPQPIPAASPSSPPVGDHHQTTPKSFSPSSFPSSNPSLPPSAPPAVQEEIVSVTEDDGAGWKRHTRVYGGGVCLACLASGGNHGEGGFYGANVRPEERR